MATTYTVTTLVDENDGGAGGTGLSLREAIALANANAGADTIEFATGPGTIRLTDPAGSLVVTEALTVNGDVNNAGTPGITITGDAGNNDATLAGGLTDIFGTSAPNLADNVAIIYSTGTANLTFNGLILTGGVSGGSGGAINAAGDLMLTNSIVSGNQSFANGGGILSIGTATLTNVALSGNRSTDNSGGGIEAATLNLTDSIVIGNTAHVAGGGVSATTATLLRSSVIGNQADSDGGGLFVFGTADLTDSTLSGNSSGSAGGGMIATSAVLENVTVSGNSAVVAGGGVYTNLDATITNSTITGNDGGGEGGGVDVDSGELINSIVLGNTAAIAAETFAFTTPFVMTGGNIVGTNVFSGNSVVGGTTLSAVFATGVLANNGGWVQTIALKADGTNPALDASDASAPAADAAGNTRIDQPGAANTNGSTADLGALELQAVVNAAPLIAHPDNVVAAAGGGPINLLLPPPFDPEGDALTITLGTPPSYGALEYFNGSAFVAVTNGQTVTASQLASLRYTPPANGEHGGETFIFTVSDGVNPPVQGTIAFTVEVDSAGPASLFFTSYDGLGKPLPDLYSVDADGNVSGPLISNPNGSDAGLDGGFYQYNGKLYFNAFESGTEYLFTMDSNGAVAKVADSENPGQFFVQPFSIESDFFEFAGRLYLRGADLIQINADGTTHTFDINGNNLTFTDNIHGGLIEFDHSLYFSAFNDTFGSLNNPDLVRVDADGTVTVISTRDVPANGSDAGVDGGFIVFNNALYFNSYSDAVGYTLFRLDAGSTTPVIVDAAEIDHSNSLGTSSAFHTFNDSLYFNEFSNSLGADTLFQLDDCGCITPLDFGGDALVGAGALGGMVDFAGSLFFVADAGTGNALFQLDDCGCIDIVYDNDGYGAFDANLVSGFGQFNGSLYFSAYTSAGDALFRLDANGLLSEVDLGVVGTINAGVEGGFKVLGDDLYFTGYGPNGYELFRIDAQGAVHQYDLNPGAGANAIVPGAMGEFGLFPFTVLHGTGSQDLLAGGDHNEILEGSASSDLLEGRGGNDILIGDGGADLFKFAGSGAATVDRIMDYSFEGGDVIDLSALLDANFTPTSNIMDFVRLVAVEQNLKVQVDVDGAVNGQSWSDVAILDGGKTFALNEATAYFGGTTHTLVELDIFNLRTVALADGGWATTWAQFGDDDGSLDLNIYGRVFDTQGHQVGGTFEISDPNDMADQSNLLVALPNGGFAVTWQSCDDEILTRVFDANGNDVSSGVQDVISGAPFPILAQTVTLADGGYATVWWQDDSGDANVYVRSFDADGTSRSAAPLLANATNSPVSDFVLVASFSPIGTGDHSSVVALEHGFAVTWATGRDDGGGQVHQNVFTRVFNFDGTPVTGEIQVNGADNAVTDTPSEIVWLGGDNFAVQWQSDYPSGAQQQSFTRIFNASNYTAAAPVRDDANADPNILSEPWHALGLGNGGYVSLWGQYDTSSPNADVYVQVYDANGNVASGSQAGGIKVNAVSGVPTLPDQVVKLAGGGFVVMYDSTRDDGTGGGADQDLYVRVFADDGTATSAEVMVNAANGLLDAAVETIALADGGFAVLWTQDAAAGSHQDVLLQRFSATGAKLTPPLLIGSTPFDSSDPQFHSFVSELRNSLSANQALLVAAIDSITLDFDTVFPGTGYNYFYPLDLHFLLPPVVTGSVTLASVPENSGARLITQLELLANASDPDGSTLTAINLQISAGSGLLVDNHDGTWSFTPAVDDDTAVTFSYQVTDNFGVVTDSASLDITTSTPPVNVGPTNTVPGTREIEANTAAAITGLSIADPDAGAGSLNVTLSVIHGTLTVAAVGGAGVGGSGTASVSLTGTLAQINATLGAANNVVYQGTHDFFGTDTLTVTTNDNGNTGTGGALTDTDQVTIHLNTHLIGTPDPDSFTALPGNERIDALGSNDTITLGFRLVDATVTYHGNEVIIDGPAGSHTVLTGFEKYIFTDGTVDNADGNRLVDDLFYYSQNHDVWNAHVDADAHYATFGWHERRDPSAFFSTVIYLSNNPDVAASGGNPLTHYALSGWQEGRIPSLAFDPAQYLAANPDVAAAHVDPLFHFLAVGASEGRQPFALDALVRANGFDYAYYLQNNPDVAAALVDPFVHFESTGWKEGRNPNAFFDTAGYLSTYADVRAAGVNPLDHYNSFGWHEGRDPSVDFDTNSYLAANPDVKAAAINPLVHFLEAGIHEGRSSQADGVWA